MSDKIYAVIDLKSFYASVECRERALDPLTTNLVVADASRTDKTICLAVSPSLKAYGISGRARLFEVKQRLKEVNEERHSRPRIWDAAYYATRLRGIRSALSSFFFSLGGEFDVHAIVIGQDLCPYFQKTVNVKMIHSVLLLHAEHFTR